MTVRKKATATAETAAETGGPLSEAEWARHRTAARQAFPVELTAGAALPDVLLPYQKELLLTASGSALTVVDKSRRIGATWGVGALAVLTAGTRRPDGGMDVLYLGYNLDMAREFIDTCAMWARAFMPACSLVQEFLFKDQDAHGGERAIGAYRIVFASGFEIVALSSRPRSLRGRQGLVIIDEAAFHDDLPELLKAAMALLIWGGRVLVISTHNGAENAYNELIQDIRSGRRPGKVARTTFDEALEQGLYQRICLVTRRPWSPEGEATWRAEIRGFYGEAAAEELDCVPRNSGGRYLPRTLIEARMQPVPVLTWACTDAFAQQPDAVRAAACQEWLDDEVTPCLERLDPALRSVFGEDFGRSIDLTVIWPLQLGRDLRRVTPFILELSNVPFRQQEQILFHVVDRLPRLTAGALDAGGNGQFLAEVAMQRYGAGRIHEVKLSLAWYSEQMPRFRAALEDDRMLLARSADVLEDLRAIELVRGVPQIVGRTGNGQRHGDAAIAACLAWFASEQLGGPPVEFEAIERAFDSGAATADFGDFANRYDLTGFL